MQRLRVIHRGHEVGTLGAPESLRPPISLDLLAMFQAGMTWWSRSPHYVVRRGDLRFALRGCGMAQEIVVIAIDTLGSHDIACLVGFEAAWAAPAYELDEDVVGLAISVAARVPERAS